MHDHSYSQRTRFWVLGAISLALLNIHCAGCDPGEPTSTPSPQDMPEAIDEGTPGPDAGEDMRVEEDLRDDPDPIDDPDLRVLPEQEQCDAPGDEDADGFTDCEDPDCSDQPLCEGIAPSARALAPPLDPTKRQDVLARYGFVASNPTFGLQRDIRLEELEPAKLAHIRGRVVSGGADGMSEEPLLGARVRVKAQEATGWAPVQPDGSFDMLVEGRGKVRLSVNAPGHVLFDTEVTLEAQSDLRVPDIVLLPEQAQATRIELNQPDIQAVSGDRVDDPRGQRQAHLLLEPGVTASAVMPDGTRVQLDALDLRLTEVTAGGRPYETMSAPLPANTALTWAAEFSVEQARAMGAERVEFSQPQPLALTNLLDLPVGMKVPVGYYNRQRGVWEGDVPALVVGRVGQDGFDLDGDGTPEDPQTLDEAGLTEKTRQWLARTYDPDDSFWFARLPHLSTWDVNMNVICGIQPTFVGQKICSGLIMPALKDTYLKTPDCAKGSIIECSNQAMGQVIGLAGTGRSLVYRSSDHLGHSHGRQLDIPILPPASEKKHRGLIRAAVRVSVAGRLLYDAELTQLQDEPRIVEVEWDGLDAYGRLVNSGVQAHVGIVYWYPGKVGGPSAWNMPSGGQVDNIYVTPDGSQMGTVSTYTIDLPAPRSGAIEAFGGLSLSGYHTLDPDGTLWMGDGRRLPGHAAQQSMNTRPIPALDVAGDDQGRALLLSHECVRRYDPVDESFETLIGDCGDAGDRTGGANNILAGEPGTASRFAYLKAVSVGPDQRIWALQRRLPGQDTGPLVVSVAQDGSELRLEAGTGVAGEASRRTWGPDASFDPHDLHVTSSGEVYISSLAQDCLHRLGTDGFLEPVWGQCVANPVPATQRHYGELLTEIKGPLGFPASLTEDNTGSILAVRRTFGDVVRFGREGTLELVAGGPEASFYNSDGAPAAEVRVAFDSGIAGGPNGEVYFLADDSVLVETGPDRLVRMLDYTSSVRALDAGPDGRIWGHGFDGLFYLASSIDLPDQPGRRAVADPNGLLLYVFDANGVHLQTLDARTLVVLETFEHDPDGRLSRIIDRSGRETMFIRDRGGNLLSVISPDAHRTDVVVNGLGLVETISDPSGRSVNLAWQSEPAGATPLSRQQAGNLRTRSGLMTGFTDKMGFSKSYEYDDRGLLIAHVLAGGERVTFEREQESSIGFYGQTVTRTSPEGRVRRWRTNFVDGTHEVLDATGIEHQAFQDESGSAGATWASGETLQIDRAPNPRLKGQSTRPVRIHRELPSGTALSTRIRYIDTLASDGVSLETSTLELERTGTQGRVTGVYDFTTRTFTHTTAEGLVNVATFDDQLRMIALEPAGLARTELVWDDQTGRLDELRQIDPTGQLPDRVTTYDYVEVGHEAGMIARVQGPDGRQVEWEIDLDALTQSVLLPATGAVQDATLDAYFTQFDANTKPTRIQPFGAGSVSLDWDRNEHNTRLTRPGATATSPDAVTNFVLDADGLLTTLEHPDGSTERFDYDATAMRLVAHTSDLEVTRPTYHGSTGLLEGIEITARPGMEELGQTRAHTYVRDGSLVLQESWLEGPDQDTVATASYGYDAALRLTRVTYQGTHEVVMSFDDDDRLETSGPLRLTYAPTHGLIESVTHDVSSHAYEHDGFGQRVRIAHAHAATPLLTRSIQRDITGRVRAERTERPGATVTELYGYDPRGRLVSVHEDANTNGLADADELIESYTWDANGNLIGYTDDMGTSIGANQIEHGADDSVTRHGDWSLDYDGLGQATRMTNSAQGVAFDLEHDRSGQLRQVRFDDGRSIHYGLDVFGRRVRRRAWDAAGALVSDKRWVYAADSMRPTAELDATGQVTRMFVWGAGKLGLQAIVEPNGRELAVACDERGSPLMVWDARTGEVIGERDYTAFGTLRMDTLTDKDVLPFGFAGGIFDPWTQLTKLGARDYAPSLPKFITTDPLSIEAGPNAYQYAFNDPINAVDPTGLFGDTLIDMAFIPLDGYVLYRDNIAGNCDNLMTNILALGSNVAFAMIPFATAGGPMTRAVAKSKFWKSGCFAPDTPVASCHGEDTPIEAVRAGDCVRVDPEATRGESRDPITPPTRLVVDLPGLGQLGVLGGVVTDVMCQAPDCSRLEQARGARYIPGDLHGSDVVPALWRSAQLDWIDAHGQRASVHLIRPLWWFEHAGLDRHAWVELGFEELGLEGLARLVDVRDDVAIDSRTLEPGQAIALAHIERISETITQLELFDLDDHDLAHPISEITITPGHPVYSVTRQTFVPAGQVEEGELVKGLDDAIWRARVAPTRQGSYLVHNLEVHRAHSFAVGSHNLVVHNTGMTCRLMREIEVRYGLAHHVLKKHTGRDVIPPKEVYEQVVRDLRIEEIRHLAHTGKKPGDAGVLYSTKPERSEEIWSMIDAINNRVKSLD